MLRNLLRRYDGLLLRQPVLTKMATSGSVAGSGNVLSQVFIEKNDKIDIWRLARFTFLGTVLVAPTLHFWYGFLARRVQTLSLRVAADQTLFAPVFIGIFFHALGALEGKMFRENIQEWTGVWATTVRVNWVFWIPIQIINLGFAPARLQVLVSNFAGVVWNAFLTFMAERSREHAEK